MSQIPGFLTVAEAADMIGVSHAQVTRYIRDDLIEHAEVGKIYLIPEAAAKKFERPRRGNPAFLTDENPVFHGAKKKKRKSA